MRSSGSTPSRPARPSPRCYVWVVGDDHPKYCTGRRLLALGLAAPYRFPRRGSAAPLLLDPFAQDPLSRSDRGIAARGGILAIDCSWNRLSERGRFDLEGTARGSAGGGRRLPFLIATNPQHFGRVGELNTAEALGAALWLLGFSSAAREILDGFAGGPAFFTLNRERLEQYVRAIDAPRVRALERSLFGPPAPTVTRSAARASR
jgi:pre-rRNA-processing protein TSR3